MVNLLPTMRLTQLVLKRKFPSVDKSLRIKVPPKVSPSKRVTVIPREIEDNCSAKFWGGGGGGGINKVHEKWSL